MIPAARCERRRLTAARAVASGLVAASCAAVVTWASAVTWAAEPEDKPALKPVASAADKTADKTAAEPSRSLAGREAQLLQQYRDLERSFLRLADLLDATDPRRAALLRSACERARSEQVADRLETTVRLLEEGKLLKAGTSQQGAIGQLRALLDLLAAGADDRRLTDEKQQVKEFLARLGKTIARQRDVGGSTESAAREQELADRQRAVAEDTRALAEDLGRFASRAAPAAAGNKRQPQPGQGEDPVDEPKPDAEPGPNSEKDPGQDPGKQAGGGERSQGKPGESSPQQGAAGDPQAGPPDESQADDAEGDDEPARASRARQRLREAESRMRAAQQRLEAANRSEARREQQRAAEELETARAELEEILRQMREEEVERLLVQLEARVREMLRTQKEVRAAAERLAAAAENGDDRQRQLESARVGREQATVAAAASKALVVVRDDGSAVAIPQALEQVRDDATQAAARFERGDVGGTTQGIVADLVVSLEEILAALEKVQRDRQEGQQAGRAGGQPGSAQEQPLVDSLAELKMLRGLQLRVNSRTDRLTQLLGDSADEAGEPEIRDALARLAERQRLIERAAHDIVAGRTE